MGQPRRAKKIDDNQVAIVSALRLLPGVSVEVDHDDIFVGYAGKNFWYELKSLEHVNLKTRCVQPSRITKSERDRLLNWTGHYRIVWCIEQILDDLGIKYIKNE